MYENQPLHCSRWHSMKYGLNTNRPRHTNLRRHLGDQTVVGLGMNGTIDGDDDGEAGRCGLDKRNERASDAEEAGFGDRRAGVHVVEPSGANTRGAEEKRKRRVRIIKCTY